jgi:hypothetical protein
VVGGVLPFFPHSGVILDSPLAFVEPVRIEAVLRSVFLVTHKPQPSVQFIHLSFMKTQSSPNHDLLNEYCCSNGHPHDCHQDHQPPCRETEPDHERLPSLGLGRVQGDRGSGRLASISQQFPDAKYRFAAAQGLLVGRRSFEGWTKLCRPIRRSDHPEIRRTRTKFGYGANQQATRIGPSFSRPRAIRQ